MNIATTTTPRVKRHILSVPIGSTRVSAVEFRVLVIGKSGKFHAVFVISTTFDGASRIALRGFVTGSRVLTVERCA